MSVAMNLKEITFIIPSLGKGGAERVVSNLANQMVQDGYKINIYTILSNEEFYPIHKDVTHKHVEVYEKNKIVRIIKRYVMLRNMVKADSSHCVIAFDRFYGICSALGTGKKVIGTERNDPYSNMPRWSLQKFFRDWLYRKVDCVVFQTQYAQQYFSKKIQNHSVIIPNPVAEDILPAPHLGARNKEIVTACRLTKQKNIPMMIEAFEIFVKKHSEYELVIYGEGELREELIQLVREKKLYDKIKFAGYEKDLPQKIVSAAMYVSSSDYEGISNSMLESLAIGIPTVCTDCPAGGAAMAIQNGVNGYLTPVQESQAMAEAMSKIVDFPELTEKMCTEAIKIREKYHIKKIADAWESVTK